MYQPIQMLDRLLLLLCSMGKKKVKLLSNVSYSGRLFLRILRINKPLGFSTRLNSSFARFMVLTASAVLHEPYFFAMKAPRLMSRCGGSQIIMLNTLSLNGKYRMSAIMSGFTAGIAPL